MDAQSPASRWRKEIDIILDQGPLATRILKALGPDPSREKIGEVYGKLSDHLARNVMFEG